MSNLSVSQDYEEFDKINKDKAESMNIDHDHQRV